MIVNQPRRVNQALRAVATTLCAVPKLATARLLQDYRLSCSEITIARVA